jgi:DNA modification methylase
MDNLAQEQSSGTTKSDIASIVGTHSVHENIRDFKLFLANAYRLLPESGYCVFWCDIDHWEKLRDIAYETGFKVQRWPLIWQKTHTCKNEAAHFNFTKNSEIAMVCRKGVATLITPQGSSFWSGSNEAEKAMLGHPFVKPFKLWEWILSAVASKGQRILDPYAGVGSFGIAAVNAGYLPISIEVDEIHYNRLVVNVANAYKALHPNVQFT